MYEWIESELRLNRQAVRVEASGAVFLVHYWGVNACHYSNSLHKHSFFEICYVLNGEGTYLDDGTLYPLGKGTLFCSRPDIPHQIRSDSGLQLLFVAFEPDEHESNAAARSAFQALAAAKDICLYNGDDLPPALLWRSLLSPADQRPGLPEAAVPALAGALLLSFASLFGGEAAAEPVSRHRSAALLLKQAKLYIRDNLADSDLSLGKVVRASPCIAPPFIPAFFL
ncbi:AraC family ligand binding domain-containing protein [Paenibacillus sp. P25]|nr:AraC family ligand binding domain-containing protein [Paenibacillus sp. P25]